MVEICPDSLVHIIITGAVRHNTIYCTHGVTFRHSASATDAVNEASKKGAS
jgi:hypothetical protein